MRILLVALICLVISIFSAGPVLAAGGGPDNFGYTWNDGIPFVWIDASDGTIVDLEDDELAGPFPIGFSFEFYGHTVTQFYLSANGRIAFSEQPETFTIPCIPSESPYLGYIALYWDDLDAESSGDVYFKRIGAEPNRFLVVMYDQVLHWGSETDTITAELALSEQTGDILLQYLDASDEAGAGATVGIMSPDGDDGLSIVCNQAVLSDNYSLRIDHPPYIQMTAPDDAAAAPAGSNAEYDLTVRNVTGTEATVLISFAGNSWDAAATPSFFTLDVGQSQTVQVEVDVPGNAFQWSSDTVEVIASWVEEPDVESSVELFTVAGPDWQLVADALPQPVQETAVVTDSQYIYVFSNYLAPGIDGTLSRFNLEGTVEELAELDPAVNVTDGVYLWDKLVFPGGVLENGEITDQLSVYDISDAEWITEFTMPQPVAFAAAVVLDEQLYVIGGFDGEEALGDVWRFDPGPAQWHKMTSMNHSRIRPAAGIVGGKILVAGGNDLTYLDSVEIYDAEADEWIELNPLPEQMYAMADCTCNDKMFLIGGQFENEALNSVLVYDASIDNWAPISPMQTGRFATEADLLSGNIVIAGGMAQLFEPTADAETLFLDCADEIVINDGDFGSVAPDDDDDDSTPPVDDDDDDTDTPDDDDDDSGEDCCGC